MNRALLRFVFLSMLLCACSEGDRGSHAESDVLLEKQLLVVIPLDVETLFPVTRQSIWSAGCRVELTPKLSEAWVAALTGQAKSLVQFESERVRIALRIDKRIIYADANAAVEMRAGNDVANAQAERQRLSALVLSGLPRQCRYHQFTTPPEQGH